MGPRVRIGDVFEVTLDASSNGYFQYISDDLTQLNSYVVRVFRESYRPNPTVNLERIVSGAIAFHAHVFLKNGLKQGKWRKVGNTNQVGNIDVLFRDSTDYGNPGIKVSQNWHIWKPNGPFEDVGRLTPEYQHAEIGVVVPADSLVHRMRTGRYDFVYPDY